MHSPQHNVPSSTGLVELPWGAWYGDRSHTLALPEHWSIDVLAPQAAAALTPGEIENALAGPLGAPPLDELAAGCESVCIVVDDLARPTRAGDILQPLLSRLAAARVAESSIDVVVATGSHGKLDRGQIGQKVGEAIADRYRVQCHDCNGPLAATGIRYGDRELCINRTFFDADLKIAVGCVLPHSFAGFSGGAKLVLPGLSDLQATSRSHKFVQLGLRGGSDPNENRFRTEAEEIARQLGLRFCVCAVTDASRQATALCAGDVVAAHRAACEIAKDKYATEVNHDYDVVLLNAYPKDIDLIQADNAFVALKSARTPIVRPDGVYLLSTAASQGVGRHGLFAPDGLSYRAPAKKRQLGSRELWVYAPDLTTPEVRQLYWDGYPVFHEPDSLKRALAERFPEETQCAVFPCAPMQQIHDLRSA